MLRSFMTASGAFRKISLLSTLSHRPSFPPSSSSVRGLYPPQSVYRSLASYSLKILITGGCGEEIGGGNMRITALLVLRTDALTEEEDPVILANASDVSHFGYFRRSSVKEFIVFVSRTVAKRTFPGQRQSVQHSEYKVHAYNKGGLCALGFMDDHYPLRSSFSLLNQVLDEYQKSFGETWRNIKTDNAQPWPYLNEALSRYQDPAEADKLLKIQKELDETQITLHKTIDSVLELGEKLYSKVEKGSDHSATSQHDMIESVLERGEKLDSLVVKSSDLSAASQMFYKQAKKTDQCCLVQ